MSCPIHDHNCLGLRGLARARRRFRLADAFDAHAHREKRLVRLAGRFHERIDGTAHRHETLRENLEIPFRIPDPARLVGRRLERERGEHRARRRKSAVEPRRADDGLDRVGQRFRVVRERLRALVALQARGEVVTRRRRAKRRRA